MPNFKDAMKAFSAGTYGPNRTRKSIQEKVLKDQIMKVLQLQTDDANEISNRLTKKLVHRLAITFADSLPPGLVEPTEVDNRTTRTKTVQNVTAYIKKPEFVAHLHNMLPQAVIDMNTDIDDNIFKVVTRKRKGSTKEDGSGLQKYYDDMASISDGHVILLDRVRKTLSPGTDLEALKTPIPSIPEANAIRTQNIAMKARRAKDEQGYVASKTAPDAPGNKNKKMAASAARQPSIMAGLKAMGATAPSTPVQTTRANAKETQERRDRERRLAALVATAAYAGHMQAPQTMGDLEKVKEIPVASNASAAFAIPADQKDGAESIVIYRDTKQKGEAIYYVGMAGTSSKSSTMTADVGLLFGQDVREQRYYNEAKDYSFKQVLDIQSKLVQTGERYKFIFTGHSLGGLGANTLRRDFIRQERAPKSGFKSISFNAVLPKNFVLQENERIVEAEGDKLANYFGALSEAPENKAKLETITGDKIDEGADLMISQMSPLGNHKMATLLNQFAEDDNTADKDEYATQVRRLELTTQTRGQMRATVSARLVEENRLAEIFKQREDQVAQARRLAGLTDDERLAEAVSKSTANLLTPPGHLAAVDLTGSPTASPTRPVSQPGSQGFQPVGASGAAGTAAAAAGSTAAAAAAGPSQAAGPTAATSSSSGAAATAGGNAGAGGAQPQAQPAAAPVVVPPAPRLRNFYFPPTQRTYAAGVIPDSFKSTVQAQEKAFDNKPAMGNSGDQTSSLRDIVHPALQTAVNTLFHKYAKSMLAYKTNMQGRASRKILMEYYKKVDGLSIGDISKLNDAILITHASLWDIVVADLTDIEPLSLFRYLSLLLCRYRDIRQSGEDLHGIIARVKGSSSATEDGSSSSSSSSSSSPSSSSPPIDASSGAAASKQADDPDADDDDDSIFGSSVFGPDALSPEYDNMGATKEEDNIATMSRKMYGGTTKLQSFGIGGSGTVPTTEAKDVMYRFPVSDVLEKEARFQLKFPRPLADPHPEQLYSFRTR